MYFVIVYSVDGSEVCFMYYFFVGFIVIIDFDGVLDCVGKVNYFVVRVNR